MRFQEFYESPVFNGKIFTREDFEDWYDHAVGSPYHFDWVGFNFPIDILNTFVRDARLHDFTRKEYFLLSDLMEAMIYPGYVIAGKSKDEATIGHELVHAVYHLNPDYRAEVNQSIEEFDQSYISGFKKYLTSIGYCDSVLVDELNAYHCTGFSRDIIAIDATLRKTLRGIFLKYYPKVWGKNWFTGVWSNMIHIKLFTRNPKTAQYKIELDAS